MSDAPKLLLDHHLKTLKLPTFLREYDKLARQCAAESLDHVRFLARLVELELIDRERRMIERRIRAARFPATKSLDSFDFKAIPSLNKMHVLDLARCEWIERRENVIALGPSGTGKTHVALGLGLAACQKGLSTGFTTAAALVHELMEARDERRLMRLQKQMAGHKLLIIDELGFVPLVFRRASLTPLAGVSASKNDPLLVTLIRLPTGHDGGWVGDEGRGHDCTDPARLSGAGQGDQGDRARVARVAEHGAQGSALG